MVDPAEIQSRYNAMSDEELTHFANEEGGELTETAFLILKGEFMRRNLDSALIRSIEDGSHNEEKARLKRISKSVPEQGESTASALAVALNEKRDGKNDEAIVYHLMDIGMDEERARLVLTQLRPEALLLVGRARNTMLTSMFAVCAGLALYLISPFKPVITFLDILSTCVLVFGTFRLLIGFINYKKFTSILRQIEKEQASGIIETESGFN